MLEYSVSLCNALHQNSKHCRLEQKQLVGKVDEAIDVVMVNILMNAMVTAVSVGRLYAPLYIHCRNIWVQNTGLCHFILLTGNTLFKVMFCMSHRSHAGTVRSHSGLHHH